MAELERLHGALTAVIAAAGSQAERRSVGFGLMDDPRDASSTPCWVRPPGRCCASSALVVFAEDAFFVGFVLPGETAAILGGVAASRPMYR